MNADISYRHATEDDAPGIIELFREKYDNNYPKDWFKEGLPGLLRRIDDFTVAVRGTEVLGCVALNRNYWPGIDVTYLESLIVANKAEKQGIGTTLTREIVEAAGGAIVTLDRYTSASLMLKLGFKPVAFLPYREFFSKNRESLLLACHGCDDAGLSAEQELPIKISKIRTKSYEGKTYLLEIVGNRINLEAVQNAIRDNANPEYVQVVNQRQKQADRELDGKISSYSQFNAGSFTTPSGFVVEIFLYVSESLLERQDILHDIQTFADRLSQNEEAMRVIEKVARQVRRQ